MYNNQTSVFYSSNFLFFNFALGVSISMKSSVFSELPSLEANVEINPVQVNIRCTCSQYQGSYWQYLYDITLWFDTISISPGVSSIYGSRRRDTNCRRMDTNRNSVDGIGSDTMEIIN